MNNLQKETYRSKVEINENTYTIGTMFCIGQNYADHIIEMGGKNHEEPLVFIKPPQAYVKNNEVIRLPNYSDNIQYEVELVALVGEEISNVSVEDALTAIVAYAVGVDLTLRDIQKKSKEKGAPWSVAKGFYRSAPISDFIPSNMIDNPNNLFLELKQNGELKQQSPTAYMLRSLAELVAYISKIFVLLPGDLIFTGTPAGVGKIYPNDIISSSLKDMNGNELCKLKNIYI